MKDNMHYGASNLIFQKAEELRNNMTLAEEILWKEIHINQWKAKFRRQHPIAIYIVDFYCHSLKLVIELDGSIHDTDEAKKNDEIREEYLKELGLRVIRFKNGEVYKEMDKVLNTISSVINDTTHTPHNTPLGDGGSGKKKLYVIKIGGNIIDNEDKLASFLKDFAELFGAPSPQHPFRGRGLGLLVHGGGKLATKLAADLGIEQQLIDGRRITDAATLKIVTMVYAGAINKNVVAQLQANGCNAIGLTGADGNAIKAHKRNHPTIDYGFVGDVDTVNTGLLRSLLEQNIAVVLAPITHDGNGLLLNTNADTIAQEAAKALSSIYDVELIYSFEKSGVLMNADDDASVISAINPTTYKDLKEKQIIFAGMIPKLDNAFAAINSGVSKVIIGKAEQLQQLIKGEAGTTIKR
jgi:acetylglutamate kinase